MPVLFLIGDKDTTGRSNRAPKDVQASLGNFPAMSEAARARIPGARLVREWRGRTHTVTVTEDGFEYDGGHYPSLTKIARSITGTLRTSVVVIVPPRRAACRGA